MFIERIESLRKKPKAVRNRYAFGTALTVTLLIGLVWGVSLPARFDNSFQVSEETKAEQAEIAEQLGQLRDLVSGGVDGIKAQAELVGSTIDATSTIELVSAIASSTSSYAPTTTLSATTSSRLVATSTATTTQ